VDGLTQVEAMRYFAIAIVLVSTALNPACSGGSGSHNSGFPSITTQPANQTVAVGQSATFRVVATGASPLSYQWQKSGAAISGATAASYTTPPTAAGHTGSTYRVIVSNSAGQVISNPATLAVVAATEIWNQSKCDQQIIVG
jgi:beta-galactosidase